MAEGDITFYNTAKKKLVDGDIDWLADTIKVALFTGYTPNIDTDEFFDDISTEESGTGYTAGGETLGSKTSTVDTGNDRAVIDAADVTWSGLDVGTPSHGVIYKDTGTPGTSALIAHVELGTASNGGDYTIAWNATGIATLT